MDGLRGAAAVMVALSHFVFAFQPALLSGNPTQGARAAATGVARSPLILLWNPELGVAVFFVLSGLVLAASAQATVRSLPALLVQRWLRLALPILGSSTLIWIAVEAGLLRNAPLSHINGSSWLSSQFAWTAWQWNDPWQMVRQSLFDIFTVRRHWWNQALWTMPIELIGSIGVYCGVLAARRLRCKPAVLCGIAVLAGIVLRSTPYVGFAAGVALFGARDVFRRQPTFAWVVGIILATASVIAGGMPWDLLNGPYWGTYRMLATFIPEPVGVMHEAGAILAVACLVVWSPARRLFASRVLVALGHISFMVYLCHIVVLCTLISFVILLASPSIGYDAATAVALPLYLAVLFPLATIMTRCCDTPAITFARRVAALADRAMVSAMGTLRRLRIYRLS